MEDFYAAAVDADYLIYNAAIDAPLNSLDDLLGKSALFADFKAVKDGNVWSTDRYLYQATDIVTTAYTAFSITTINDYSIKGSSDNSANAVFST
jgi:iron complex transport system substrate-binding protein